MSIMAVGLYLCLNENRSPKTASHLTAVNFSCDFRSSLVKAGRNPPRQKERKALKRGAVRRVVSCQPRVLKECIDLSPETGITSLALA